MFDFIRNAVMSTHALMSSQYGNNARRRAFDSVGQIAFVREPGQEMTQGSLYVEEDNELIRYGFNTDNLDLEKKLTTRVMRDIVLLAEICGIKNAQVVVVGRTHASALTGEIVKSTN